MQAERRPSQIEFDVYDETILHSSRAPELILLIAMRAWLRPYCATTRRTLDWRDVLFAAAIDTPGAQGFDLLMRGAIRAPAKPLDSRCRCCSSLSADEAALLHAIALLQRGRYADAVTWFAERFPTAMIEPVTCQAWRVAEAFADAGLIVAAIEREVAYLQ